ncbi:hypothetical protein MRQ47_004445 [Salmonella enterica]|nr:hypothetical protein [Salmonella enterica]
MKHIKQAVAATLIATVLAGCASTSPNPSLTPYQPGDESASCSGLNVALTTAKQQEQQAEHDKNTTTGLNVLYGITGAFILFPWFFIDPSNGHQVDITNAQARIARLNGLIGEKCNAPHAAPAETTSTLLTPASGEGE